MRRRITLMLLCTICTLMVMGQVPVTWNKAKKPTPVQPTPKPNNNNVGKKPQNNNSKTSRKVFSVTTHENGNKTFTVNGVSFTMVYVQSGNFTMGGTSEQGSDAESDEKPTQSVTLSNYYIGETEVTQGLWEAVMGSNPSYYTGDSRRPVENVSWEDCQTFINELNSLSGERFHLPTEAQWEYAARGGSKSHGYKYSGSNSLGNVAWYYDNSANSTHPVKTKSPNELGIYDMSGNVWEWCQDWYGSYSSGSQTNSTDATNGPDRVRRGGSWINAAGDCRVSNRFNCTPSIRGINLGLRLAL